MAQYEVRHTFSVRGFGCALFYFGVKRYGETEYFETVSTTIVAVASLVFLHIGRTASLDTHFHVADNAVPYDLYHRRYRFTCNQTYDSNYATEFCLYKQRYGGLCNLNR